MWLLILKELIDIFRTIEMVKYIQTSFLTRKKIYGNCQVVECQTDRFCVLDWAIWSPILSAPVSHFFNLWTKHGPRHSVENRYCCIPFPPFWHIFSETILLWAVASFPMKSTFYILTSKAIFAVCNHIFFLILQHYISTEST